jgi:tRNA(Ile)-lysidine synthase
MKSDVVRFGGGDLVDRIAYALEGPCRVEPGMKVLVAVSGGPDSMALLHAMRVLAPRMGIALCVGHVEHGIRPCSRLDADFVQKRCAEAGIPFCRRSVDAPALAAAEKLSLEDAARRLRYEALFSMAEEAGAARIALAHHMDDQAETVLMHLFRGSALGGLCGMRPFREDGVIRPMLAVRRDEVLAYCRDNGIEYRTDETNTDTRYARNALRLLVLPGVERAFPGAVESIARTASLVRDEEAFLQAYAKQAAKACLDDSGALDAAAVVRLPEAVARRVALAFLRRFGDARRIDSGHVEALLGLCGAETGAALDVPGGRVRNNYGRVAWEGAPETPAECESELEVPGVTRCGKASVRATLLDEIPNDLKCHPAAYDYFDYDAFPRRAVVRTRRPGDRFRPLGMRGSQPLKEYFIDRKVPRAVRDRTLLCADGNRIVWVAGMGVNDGVRVRPGSTRRVLRLEISGEDNFNNAQRQKRP